jgi:Flp pilus assembly protein TadG
MGTRKGPSGQALTEISIVIVLFVILAFGIIDAGRLMYNYNAVSFSAREAVRWAVVRGATSGHVATATDVQNYAQSMSMGVPINVAVTWDPDNQPGSAVVVSVRNDFSTMTPFFVPGTIHLASSSRMIISR